MMGSKSIEEKAHPGVYVIKENQTDWICLLEERKLLNTHSMPPSARHTHLITEAV